MIVENVSPLILLKSQAHIIKGLHKFVWRNEKRRLSLNYTPIKENIGDFIG